MQQVKNAFKGISDKKINITANNAQLRYVKAQIEEIQYLLAKADKGFEVGDVLKLEANLERLTNQYNKLISQQNKLNTTANKTNNNILKGFDKMTSKIKRFGLALLSVRSIYSLVSRASSAYLSQDTELANKLQSAWIGLGAILEPIINGIATIILKLVSVINGFIKSLTGVDLIARATAKSMKSASGSANSLKRSLAGFDELTNLDSDTGVAGLNFKDAFENIDTDFNKLMDSLKKHVENTYSNLRKKMVASIEDAKRILKLQGFSKEFIDMYDFASQGSLKVLDNFVESFKAIFQILRGILSGDKELILQGFKNLASSIWNIITGVIQVVVGAIGMAVTGITDLIWKGVQWLYNNILKPIGETVYEYVIKPISEWFTLLWEKQKTVAGNALNWIVNQLIGTKNNFKLFINTIATWFNNLWKNVVKGFATVWNKIANTANKIGGTFGMTKLPTINSYAVGTNYVPEDQLAFIHKGEAVIPKKYNNGGYVPNDNTETNAKLDAVIEAIQNINITPYTTIKDVGKASLSYINNKSRQLGESVVV